ncbi:MAG: hypothetical protein HY939_07885 [Gammaproteobacteria bacterium]|nr:hypothetical protein [Gammaproteobacteria bacterium]
MFQSSRIPAALHQELMGKIRNVIDNEEATFEIFTTEFEKGINHPSHYNRAIRRLCTFANPKVAPLLEAICPYTLRLQISVTETNKDGVSAVEYARRHNPAAHAILRNAISIDSDAIQKSVGPMLPGVYDAVVSRLFPTSSPNEQTDAPPREAASSSEDDALRPDQTAALENVFSQLAPALLRVLSTAPRAAATPAEQYASRQKIASDLLASLQPSITQAQQVLPQHHIPSSLPGESFKETFQRLSNHDESLQPLLAFYEQGQHEDALRWACTCKHPAIVPILDRYLKEKTLDINTMLDKHNRTPLHDAALAKNLPVYYCLGSHGAISDFTDDTGNSAADYRRSAMMSSVIAGESALPDNLFSHLFGGAADPSASQDNTAEQLPSCQQM